MKIPNVLPIILFLGLANASANASANALANAAPVAGHATPKPRVHNDAIPGESLGTVSFAVSCAPAEQANFSRGVALLHDFWYEEATPQFERIAKRNPTCAMAHWGIAMSVFHEIWDRPDEEATARAWRELRAAQSLKTKTERERAYIAALSGFFRPDGRPYQAHIDEYAAAMGAIYAKYPQDIDAGAFYALALLAAAGPDDTSLTQERKAMTVLTPLFAAHPDHPGVVHYIIHACDTPALAADGLAAARHYGNIAGSAPHSAHMPGHIFARLGLWQEDIDANVASVVASDVAETHHQDGAMDQFHSDDFLLYAYLQSGQDERAKDIANKSAAAIAHFASMPNMADHYMKGMFPYYRSKLPAFLALETRDWTTAAALQPDSAGPPESQVLTHWARAIAYGHLHQAAAAQSNLAGYDALLAEIKKGRHAYYADSVGTRIERGEMQAWLAFAQGNGEEALKLMRGSADLQDQVGQGEVDIPAREMLADMYLELQRPAEALTEYKTALTLSPNRFNGLYNAGMAAEATGNSAAAKDYYAALLKSTNEGSADRSAGNRACQAGGGVPRGGKLNECRASAKRTLTSAD